MPQLSEYTALSEAARQLENELKQINRWSETPLAPEKLENMGAFGSNTMSFEEWIQFVLIPRIDQIVRDQDSFPAGSDLGTYAVRNFDGDPDTGNIEKTLIVIDHIINQAGPSEDLIFEAPVKSDPVETISTGSEEIPPVLYTVAEFLPNFQDEDLENQLQTFDTYLATLSPNTRPVIADILRNAAQACTHPASKIRLKGAAASVFAGGRAAAPYNNDEAMRNYQMRFRGNSPKQV